MQFLQVIPSSNEFLELNLNSSELQQRSYRLLSLSERSITFSKDYSEGMEFLLVSISINLLN